VTVQTRLCSEAGASRRLASSRHGFCIHRTHRCCLRAPRSKNLAALWRQALPILRRLGHQPGLLYRAQQSHRPFLRRWCYWSSKKAPVKCTSPTKSSG